MVGFSDHPQEVKNVTNPEGDGVGRSVSPQNIGTGNPAPYYEVTVKDKPGAGSDQTITHTGPGAGVVGGTGHATDMQGFVSSTGNKLLIDNTFGADTITMQHHSGATIMIDGDGSIHLISTGKKGVGVISPRGDLTLYARGHLILKGEGKVTIETQGDLDFNVGGNLGFHVGGDMITSVSGSVDESIDGSKSFEVAKDMSTMIAGDYRLTSAGKMKIQSSSSIDIDSAKDINIRTDSNIAVQAQGTISHICQASMNLSTNSKFYLYTASDSTHQTQGNHTIISSGTTKISSTGAASVHSNATLDLLAAGKVQVKGSGTDVQIGGSLNPDGAQSPSQAALAQYPPANTVIDSITSIRVAPDFPLNAKKMSASQFALYKNEGGNPNPQAEAFAAGNKGSGAVYQVQDSGLTAEAVATGIYDRPAGSVTNNGVAEKNPLPMPTSIYNTNDKLSKHITVGQLINIRNAPASSHKQILTEAMNVSWNILDPLYEKFGGKLMISSWFRDNSHNHVKGGAVDVHAGYHDHAGTAEIAAFVRDYLPYNKVLLEKNDEGSIHCHVEAAQPGQSGGGIVLTCADPHCASSVPGLQLSYAVAALQGKNYG
jgi:Peptidase M15